MVRPKPEEIQKELDDLQKDVYGENTVSGTAPDPESDDDVEQNLTDVTGESSGDIEDEQSHNIGRTVNKAEIDIREKEIDDYEEDDEENRDSDMDIERKENVSEDPQNDPYNNYGEDDDLDTDDSEE